MRLGCPCDHDLVVQAVLKTFQSFSMDQEMEGDKSSMLGSRELDARPSRRGDRRLHFPSALESPIYIAHFLRVPTPSLSSLSVIHLPPGLHLFS